uniref:Hypothetical conserved protein n=1 Tax=uncultured Bacteroidota bacterium TaxID=152509 RepID=H5SMB9_9BACT|nr:hypothetical conserved protein [uncultured Bacteroidetes bacterium]
MSRLLPYFLLGFLGVGAAWLAYRLLSSREKEIPSRGYQTVVVEHLTQLGRIQLLRYVVRDVVQREWRYALPFTSSRLLMVVSGEATVCMDLAQVRVEEADWEQRRLRLSLPPPFLCEVRIDPKQSQVYDANFSVVEWWSGGEAERVREALAAAQETLRVRIEAHFSREAAQAQAEKMLRPFLTQMGWKEISFKHGG